METSDLRSLREKIDAIDEQLIELLAKRFRATDQVGQLKALAGMSAVDLEREQQQAQRHEMLATKNELSPVFAQQVFRLIIGEVVTKHRAIAAHREGQ